MNEKDIKTELLKYLYNKLQLYNYKFTEIKCNGDIVNLRNSHYYISANYGGIMNLLIFLEINNNYYCYLIDRRSISFTRDKLNIENVRIQKLNIAVDLKLYNGSIFDCVVIDNLNNSHKNIIITDVFYYCSKNMLTHNYKNKMLLISNIFKNNENTTINVSPTFELNQKNILFFEYIKQFSKNLNIKGISFYPEKSGIKLIYIFNKNDVDLKEKLMYNIEFINKCDTNESEKKIEVEKKIKNITVMKNVITFDLINIDDTKIIKQVFEVVKTDTSDIYKLYALFNENGNITKQKIGISYINSYDNSIKCKRIFNETKIKNMVCRFNSHIKKWIIENETDEKISVINNHYNLKITKTSIPYSLN